MNENFIDTEQFLKLDEKVQNIFLDSWKPEIGDIFSTKKLPNEIDLIVDMDSYLYGMNKKFQKYGEINVNTNLEPIPLLQMHQLIDFIEEKTNHKLELYLNSNEKYTIMLCRNTYLKYSTNEANLLQALWEVACEIAEKEMQFEELN